MTYNNIETFVISVSAILISSLLVYIVKNILIPIWIGTTAKAVKTKVRILFLARYLAIFITIFLLWFFIPFNKSFVFIVSFVFTVLILMIFYDYIIFSLFNITSNIQKEMNEEECKKLYEQLINTDNKEKRIQIVERIKKLDC